MKTNLCLLGIISTFLCLSPAAHAATRTWSGGGADNKWTNATNWVGDVAPVPGDDLFFPPGAAQNINDNDFPPGTTFNSMAFNGLAYGIGGNSIALNAGIVATNGSTSRIDNLLVLNSNQTFTIRLGSSSFLLPGKIDTNGKNLTFDLESSTAQVQGMISGAGGLIKTGSGSLALYASNTFSGPVQVLQGGLSVYHQSALGSTNGSTAVSAGASLALLNQIVTSEPFVLGGTLISAGAGTKTLNGPITINAANATIHSSPGAPLTINGVISGSGGFSSVSFSTLTLNANNPYTGVTTVSGGTLLVNGLQPASPIVFLGDVLGGTGTVGTVTVSDSFPKTFAPGNVGSGILSCSNVTLNSTTMFAVELNGTTPGSGYDQLKVTGGVTLSNAALNATLGFSSAISNNFTIIDNDGTDAVTNTFSGMAEGATVNVSGTPFRISYAGGTGNDVVLTQLTATQQPLLNIRTNGTTNVVLSWPTLFTGYALEANTNLNTNVWAVVTNIPAVSGTNNVVTNTVIGTTRFYRLRQ